MACCHTAARPTVGKRAAHASPSLRVERSGLHGPPCHRSDTLRGAQPLRDENVAAWQAEQRVAVHSQDRVDTDLWDVYYRAQPCGEGEEEGEAEGGGQFPHKRSLAEYVVVGESYTPEWNRV